MYTIRKKFKFEMAHQLDKAFSECCSDTIHGHSYTLEVFFRSGSLDDTGMVIDFGEVKEEIKDIVNRFDHALVMPLTLNYLYREMLESYNKKYIEVDYNPTAENMCKDIYYQIYNILPNTIYKVRLHETDTGYAEYKEREND